MGHNGCTSFIGQFCLSVQLGRSLPVSNYAEMEPFRTTSLHLSQKKARSDATVKIASRFPMRLGILVETATAALGEGTRAAFFLTDLDGKMLHHIVGMPDDYALEVDGLSVAPESLACGLAAHLGRAELTTDVYTDPLWKPWVWLADKYQFRACWSYPINTATGRFVGTFSVYWPEPREASTCDIERAALITQTAGIVISRFQEAQERRKAETALRETQKQLQDELADSELLREISLELAGEDGEEGLYQKVVEAAAKIMKSDVCTVQILHPDRGIAGELQMLASTGLDAHGIEYWKWVRGDSGCTCVKSFAPAGGQSRKM